MHAYKVLRQSDRLYMGPLRRTNAEENKQPKSSAEHFITCGHQATTSISSAGSKQAAVIT